MRHPTLTDGTARRQPLSGNPARELAASPGLQILAFLLLHMILAIAMDRSNMASTVHALLTLAIGLFVVVNDEGRERIMYVTAYVVGAELLWRGTGARVFWEFGKYAIIGLLALRMVRDRSLTRSSKAPLAYALLLLPSLLVLPAFDRESVSFNLGGPIALAVATAFCSQTQLARHELKRTLLALVAPIVGLGFLSFFGIVTAESLSFIPGSKATAAGIGPNQVSSILGLGAFAAFSYALLEQRVRSVRILMIGTAVWLLAQTALTFSRGGLWTGLGAMAVAGFYLLRDRSSRGLLLASAGIGLLVLNFVALPLLDDFTGGVLINRLEDTDLTGRDDIVAADLLTFRENALFGVGPGQSYQYHALTFRASSAHTEYSRLLAEHGLFGLAALILLAVMSLNRLRTSQPSPVGKAFVVSCTAWALLYMIHAAMRLAAPALLFGLAAARLRDQPGDPEAPD